MRPEKSSENSLQDVLLDSEEKHAEEMNRTKEAYSPGTENAPTAVTVPNKESKKGCCPSDSCCCCCCQPNTTANGGDSSTIDFGVCCAYLCCVGSQRETRHINFTEGTYDYHKETDINNSLGCICFTWIQGCSESGSGKNIGECVSNNACCLFKCCESSASGAGETVVNAINTVGSAGGSIINVAGGAVHGVADVVKDIGPDAVKVVTDVGGAVASVAGAVVNILG